MDNIEKLEWYEHIRKRSGMYIGAVNIKGFVEMLKGIINSAIVINGANFFSMEFGDNLKARLRFNNMNGEFENNWGMFKPNTVHPFLLDLSASNALSKTFRISFWDSNDEKVGEEYFEEGVLIEGQQLDNIECAYVEIDFILDKSIWKEDQEWNNSYIVHHLREFAYLYKKTKFEIKYQASNEDCRVVYYFKNGLKDRIDIEILNGLGSSYFETEIDARIDNIHLEAAFAFRDYSVDPPYLKSYANDYFTFENGTHVDGLLRGLTYGVMKYFQKHDLTRKYKISEKGMRENLVAAINVKLEAPVFSGCVKNKLANPEIIEPIANYISELLFKKIEEDEEATQRLIRKFEM